MNDHPLSGSLCNPWRRTGACCPFLMRRLVVAADGSETPVSLLLSGHAHFCAGC